MGSNFEEAVEITLKNEGGYVDNPADKGKATNMGISQVSFPSIDIKDLTVEQAKELYRKNFWKYDVVLSQPLANKLFDMAVMTGHGSTKVLQDLLGVTVDGDFGPGTSTAVNLEDAAQLLSRFRIGMVQYFIDVATKNPSQAVFLKGWLKRARS